MKKQKVCDYCGENEAVKTIPNPNATGENWWDICSSCDEVIKKTQEDDIKMIIKIHDASQEKKK